MKKKKLWGKKEEKIPVEDRKREVDVGRQNRMYLSRDLNKECTGVEEALEK